MTEQRPGRSPSKQGSALALSLIIVILVAGMGAALASISFSQNRFSDGANFSLAMTYAAEASLEKAILFTSTSDYDLGGNQWLNGTSMINPNAPIARGADPRFPLPGDAPVFSEFIGDPSIPDTVAGAKIRTSVYVYVLDTDGRLQNFRLIAQATYRPDALKRDERTVTLSQDVRAWDSFARYATFVNSDMLQFGSTTVKGPVHSNQGVVFRYGNGQFDNVSASGQFYYADGATPENTQIKIAKQGADGIQMPSIGDLSKLRDLAPGMLNVSSTNPRYGGPGDVIDAEIEFRGADVFVRGINHATGLEVAAGTYPIPTDGIIFVQGDVTSVKGQISSRVSVTSMGKINIGGNLIYTDSRGTPAYQLTYNGTGVANNQTDPGVAWTGTKNPDGSVSGYDYIANPAFAPDPNHQPTLGLIAADQINLSKDAPSNLEVHSSLFSLNKTWSADISARKDNLRIVGSMASNLAGSRAAGQTPDNPAAGGYMLSGGYIYEDDLAKNPPPGWLRVKSPVWGPRWKSGQS